MRYTGGAPSPGASRFPRHSSTPPSDRPVTVDLLVPVLDERAALPALLAHVRSLAAVDPSCSLLVMDGGSTDGSQDVLRDSGARWIAAEAGRGAQMNAGAAATRGDVLLFLHADTRLPPGALDAVRAAVADGAPGGFFRLRLDSSRPLLRVVGRAISLRSALTGIATGDQAIFVRRDVFERLGGYAPLPLFEDVDLCRRLRQLGRPARLDLLAVTSARRWESHGPWRTILRMWLLRLAYAAGIAPRRLARYYQAAR